MKRSRLLVASCLLLLLLVPTAGGQQTPAEPYENATPTAADDEWTQNRSDVTLVNVSHYVSRVGTFIVGSDSSDPGAGPMLSGLLVMGLALATLGTSRAGVVASGSVGVVVVAALSTQAGAGLLPGWLYGVAVLTVALLGAGIYTRLLR